MVNRELTRRVKFGQEIAWASRAVHSDLLATLNLVKFMDRKAQQWEFYAADPKVCPDMCTHEKPSVF